MDLCIISTVAVAIEIWPGEVNLSHPVVGYQVQISRAHKYLAQHVNAVVNMCAQSRCGEEFTLVLNIIVEVSVFADDILGSPPLLGRGQSRLRCF